MYTAANVRQLIQPKAFVMLAKAYQPLIVRFFSREQTAVPLEDNSCSRFCEGQQLIIAVDKVMFFT